MYKYACLTINIHTPNTSYRWHNMYTYRYIQYVYTDKDYGLFKETWTQLNLIPTPLEGKIVEIVNQSLFKMYNFTFQLVISVPSMVFLLGHGPLDYKKVMEYRRDCPHQARARGQSCSPTLWKGKASNQKGIQLPFATNPSMDEPHWEWCWESNESANV